MSASEKSKQREENWKETFTITVCAVHYVWNVAWWNERDAIPNKIVEY